MLKSDIKDNKSAVLTSYDAITFGQLNRRADFIRGLMRPRSTGDAVVFLKPNADYYASLLACMKSGVTAVPIDLNTPDNRIDEWKKRIHVSHLITTKDLYEKRRSLFSDLGGKIVCIDHDTDPASLEEPDARPDPSTAIVHKVITSGSSGRETLISHTLESLLHDNLTTGNIYGIDEDSIIANLGRYSASLGINAFWRSVNNGATFVTFDFTIETMESVWRRIADSKAGMLQGQKTLLMRLLNSQPDGSVNSNVKRLITGGEPIEKEQFSKIFRYFPSLQTVTHNYSSSETMLISCHTVSVGELLAMDKIHVGIAAPGKYIRILDKYRAEVPHGGVGQIVVQSKYIAIHLDGHDAEHRLTTCPNNPLERIYYTGDLGRINDEGFLEHMGRIDGKVKILGKRIDLQLIESALSKVDGVLQAAVTTTNSDETLNQIVAFVALDPSCQLGEAHIRATLDGTLPASHMPNLFKLVSNIPQLTGGKPDYGRMREIALQDNQTLMDMNPIDNSEFNDLHRTITKVWQKCLKLDHVTPHRSVFMMGADSLSIFQVTALLNDIFGVSLEPSWILDNPTVHEQSSYIEEKVVRERDTDVFFDVDKAKFLLGW